MPHIFHIALPEQWTDALESGAYSWSTRGRTLEEEGFLHAADAEQVEGVRRSFYADLGGLLLLTIDTGRLTSPWQYDEVDDQRFPHIYGPLNTDAVVDVAPLIPGT